MAVLFSIHTGGNRHGTVHALDSATGAGVFHGASGRILVADPAAVRAALPHKWRKAYDRASGLWYDKAGVLGGMRYTGTTPFLTLRDRRGVFLATLYAIPYEFKAGE